MNKKAQELAVYGLAAVLVIILTLALYWYLIVIPNNIGSSIIKQSIVAKEKVDADLVLLNYLRTPVSIEGKELFISDLARLYYIDKSKYENTLKEETSKIFNSVFRDYLYQIKFGDEIIADNGFNDKDEDYIINAINIIPLENSGVAEIHLEVNLKK